MAADLTIPAYRWPEKWLTRRYAPWRWLAASAFWIAWLCGRIASLFAAKLPAVAILRTDGAGDAILFEPAIRSLAKQFEGRELHLWAPDLACTLMEHHPAIRRSVRVPRGYKVGCLAYFWSLPWRLKLGYATGRHRYDVAVFPPDDPEPLGSWLLTRLNAREKWLNAGSTLNQFDWQRESASKQATTLLQPRGGGHELLRNAHLAAQWGAAIEVDRPTLILGPRAATYAGIELGAARHTARRARAAGVVAIIPSGSAAINQYPIDQWVDVIKQLWNSHRLLSAMLAGPADQPLLDQLQQRLGNAPHHRLACDDIAVAAAMVSRLDGVIAIDTGLAHAAVAFDVPTVALVTGGMPGRFWPWPGATRSASLTRATPCAGCNYRCTEETVKCLVDVEPEQIVNTLVRLMRARATLPIHSDALKRAG